MNSVILQVELVIIPRSVITDNRQEQQNQPPPPPPPPPPQNQDSSEDQNQEEDKEVTKQLIELFEICINCLLIA